MESFIPKRSHFVWTTEAMFSTGHEKRPQAVGRWRPPLARAGIAARRSDAAPPQPSRPQGVREEPGKANRCEPNDGQRRELRRGRALCEHVAANVGETAGMTRECASGDGRKSAIRLKNTPRTASWRDALGFLLQLQMFLPARSFACFSI